MAAETYEDVILTSKTGIWTDSRAYASLAALVSDIGNNSANIVIAQNETVTGNLTIPAGYNLRFEGSSVITVGGGNLLINTVRIDAPERQIFASLNGGTVEFKSSEGGVNLVRIKTCWFGGGLGYWSNCAGGDVDTLLEITENTTVTSARTVDAISIPGPNRVVTVSEGASLSVGPHVEAGPWYWIAGSGTWTFTAGTVFDSRWFENELDTFVSIVGAVECTLECHGTINAGLESLQVPANISMIVPKGGFLSATAACEIQGVVVVFESGWYSPGLVTVSGNLVDLSKEIATADNIYDVLNAGTGVIDPDRLHIGVGTVFETGYNPNTAYLEAIAAQGNVTSALATIGALQTQVDGKVNFFYQNLAPVVSSCQTGDVWIDLDGGNAMYRLTSSAGWTISRDTSITAAAALAQNAIDGLQSKITTFFELSTEPPTALNDGDLWYQTDTTDLYVWNSSAWQLARFGEIVARDTTAPTSPKEGDLWYNPTTKITKRWDDTESQWESVGDQTQTIIDGGLITTGSIQVADSEGAVTAGLAGAEEAGDEIRIWAGDLKSHKSVAPFRVYDSGKVFLSGGLVIDSALESSSATLKCILDPLYGDPMFQLTNSAGATVFQCMLGGENSGDVQVGYIDPETTPAAPGSSSGFLWDQSAGTMKVFGKIIGLSNINGVGTNYTQEDPQISAIPTHAAIAESSSYHQCEAQTIDVIAGTCKYEIGVTAKIRTSCTVESGWYENQTPSSFTTYAKVSVYDDAVLVGETSAQIITTSVNSSGANQLNTLTFTLNISDTTEVGVDTYAMYIELKTPDVTNMQATAALDSGGTATTNIWKKVV